MFKRVSGHHCILKRSLTGHSARVQHHIIQRFSSSHSAGINSELSREQIDRIRVMLRVDLAGEVAANRIYEGQKLVLGGDPKTAQILEEKEHLETLKELSWRYNARETIFTPLAHGIAYALGVGTAMLGKEAAMTCTEAVETVVAEHYNKELLEMKPQNATVELRAAIRKMRDEELEHKDVAEENGSTRSPCYNFLNKFIQTGCKIAISAVSRA